MASTLGIRNNNPGNLVWFPGAEWKGLAKPPYRGRFCVFVEPLDGIRALIMQIFYDHYRHGKNTIAEVIATWAPPFENNTNAYIDAVASYVGHYAWEQIDFTDKGLIIGMAQAIVREENGLVPYPYSLFDLAADQAYYAFNIAPRRMAPPEENSNG